MVTSVIPNWLPMKAGEVVFGSDQPNFWVGESGFMIATFMFV